MGFFLVCWSDFSREANSTVHGEREMVLQDLPVFWKFDEKREYRSYRRIFMALVNLINVSIVMCAFLAVMSVV